MKPLPLKLLQFLLFLTSIASLCLPAIINGYPIANPDSNTYIESGFIPEVPMDRPITYGILVRMFSLNGISLWLVVISQAVLITYTVRTCVLLTIKGNAVVVSYFIVILLAILSSVSWITSELIADVYTPIMILSIACIASYPKDKKPPIALYLILLVAVAAHTSHLSISLSIFFFLWLFRSRIHEQQISRSKYTRRVFVMVALSLSTYCVNMSVYSKSSAVFMTAAMINKGIVNEYLDKECATIQNRFCAYKDNITTNSDIFLWHSESPMTNMGGWAGSKEDCKQMNRAILLTYPYNWHFIQKSIEHTYFQLQKFNVGDGNYPLADNVNLCKSINKHISPIEEKNFLLSKQNTNKLIPIADVINTISTIAIVCSIVIILLIGIFISRYIPKVLWWFTAISTLSVFLNAIHCATFSLHNGRYGCRITWLIPLCAMLLVLSVIRNRKGANQ